MRHQTSNNKHYARLVTSAKTYDHLTYSKIHQVASWSTSEHSGVSRITLRCFLDDLGLIWCKALSSRGQVSEIRGSYREWAKTLGNPDFSDQILSK